MRKWEKYIDYIVDDFMERHVRLSKRYNVISFKSLATSLYFHREDMEGWNRTLGEAIWDTLFIDLMRSRYGVGTMDVCNIIYQRVTDGCIKLMKDNE